MAGTADVDSVQPFKGGPAFNIQAGSFAFCNSTMALVNSETGEVGDSAWDGGVECVEPPQSGVGRKGAKPLKFLVLRNRLGNMNLSQNLGLE